MVEAEKRTVLLTLGEKTRLRTSNAALVACSKHTYSEVVRVTSYVEDGLTGLEVQQVLKWVSLLRACDFLVWSICRK